MTKIHCGKTGQVKLSLQWHTGESDQWMNGMLCNHTILPAPDCFCEQGTQLLCFARTWVVKIKQGGYRAEYSHDCPLVFGDLKSTQIIQYAVKQEWSYYIYIYMSQHTRSSEPNIKSMENFSFLQPKVLSYFQLLHEMWRHKFLPWFPIQTHHRLIKLFELNILFIHLTFSCPSTALPCC